ncbi:MAG: LysR family transcriptional regulator [Myxococcota bacterium]
MRNWDDLRLLLVTARHGTLSRAAAELGMNKSTASRRLGQLESELGVRLLELRGRKYLPTEAGRRLLDHASAVEQRLHEVERELVGGDAHLAGSITLATTDVLAREVLPAHLSSFAEAYPAVRLTLLAANRLHAMNDGEAHVALRHGARPSDPNLVAKKLCDVAAGFYAAHGYTERHGRPHTYAALADHRILGFHEELGALPAAKLIDELVPRHRVAQRHSDLGAHVAAVEAGLGIAPLPCFAAAPRQTLTALFPPEERLRSGLWLVWHRDLRESARVRALVTHLTRALVSQRALFEGQPH